MVSIKTELGKPQKDGSRAVYIRLGVGSKLKRIRFYMDATAKDVNAKGEITDGKLEYMLGEEIQKMRKRIFDAGQIIETWPAEKVFNWITTDSTTPKEESFQLDFIAFGREQANKMMRDGREKTAEGYIIALRNFCKFLKRDSIDINEITKRLLVQYAEWFDSEGIGSRAKEQYMSNLRTLHSRAKDLYNDEDAGYVPIRLSPFTKVEFRRTAAEARSVEKRALSAKTMHYLFDLPHIDTRAGVALDAFLLSFGLCGMNAADMFEHVGGAVEGVISYSRKKTRRRSGSEADTRVTIPVELRDVHARLVGKRHTWLFAERYSNANCLNHALNDGIREAVEYAVDYYADKWGKKHETEEERNEVRKALGLPADLTFYAARHSWATIAANDCAVSMEIVDRCLCHVVKSVAAVSYVKRDFRYVDEANGKVMAAVFKA